VKFELDRAPDSFVILSKESDAEKYKLKILNIALFVPVAQLAAPVFQEINTILTRKNEPKAIGIHYRRLEVRQYSMTRNKIEHNSDGLFSDEEMPCRIVIGFVLTKSKVGDRHLNPYDFRRSWTVETTSSNEQIDRSLSERELYLEQKLMAIEAQFQEFQEQMLFKVNQKAKPKCKGKGKGKKSKETQIEEEAQRRLRSFISAQQNRATSDNENFLNFPSTSAQVNQSRMSDDAWTNDSSSSTNFLPTYGPNPPPTPTPLRAKKQIFIRKVELTINGNPIDMIEDKQTEDECIQGLFFCIYFLKKLLT
jgi:hypothetical protein